MQRQRAFVEKGQHGVRRQRLVDGECGRQPPPVYRPKPGGTSHRPGTRFGPQDVRSGAFVDLGWIGGRRAAECRGQRLLARRVLRIGQPELGEDLAVEADDAPHLGDAAAHRDEVLEQVILAPHAVKRLIEPEEVAA